MTSYIINYEGLDPVAKHNQAIADTQEYLGPERFEKLTALFKEQPYTLDQFQMAASFAGVQGYPAKAWYNYCYPL